MLESLVPPKLKLRLRHAIDVLAVAVVVVIFPMATKTESAQV